jgi:hypothetical protein
MTEFRSRAVRSLVELHAAEFRRFIETWKRFKASGRPMPDPRGDSDYETPERLAAHIQNAARGYILWASEMLGRPITEIQRAQSWEDVWKDFDGFAEQTLAAWEKHGALITDEELEPAQSFRTRWGAPYGIEQMLEHAVVHPMRHRIQLERLMG